MPWVAKESVPTDPMEQCMGPRNLPGSALRQYSGSTPNSSTHLGLWARIPTQARAHPFPTPCELIRWKS